MCFWSGNMIFSVSSHNPLKTFFESDSSTFMIEERLIMADMTGNNYLY